MFVHHSDDDTEVLDITYMTVRSCTVSAVSK